MRFTLVDRIEELEPGARITTIKNLTMAEEYLAEHFPSFPVMPGVLMLEAITQTGAWLLRWQDQFACAVILLHEAWNVKFGQFVAPGMQLRLTCEIQEDDGRRATFKVKGTLTGQTSVSARVALQRFPLAEHHPVLVSQEGRLRLHLANSFQKLLTPELQAQLAVAERLQDWMHPSAIAG